MTSQVAAGASQNLPPNTDPGPRYLAVLWAFTCAATVMMALRLFTRVARRNLGWDDWTMLATILTQIATAAVNTSHVLLGSMRKIIYINPQSLPMIIILSDTSLTLGIVTLFLGKCSVGLLLLRILEHTRTWRTWFVWSNIVMFLLLSLMAVAITWAQCIPAKAAWEPQLVAEGKAHCLPSYVSADTGMAQSAYGAFMDVVFALLPLSIFWKLAMPLKRRIALSVLLSLGLIAAVFACLKTSQFPPAIETNDPFGDSFLLYTYTCLEWGFVAIAGCVPPCIPLYLYFVKGKPLFAERKPSAQTWPLSNLPLIDKSRLTTKASSTAVGSTMIQAEDSA